MVLEDENGKAEIEAPPFEHIADGSGMKLSGERRPLAGCVGACLDPIGWKAFSTPYAWTGIVQGCPLRIE